MIARPRKFIGGLLGLWVAMVVAHRSLADPPAEKPLPTAKIIDGGPPPIAWWAVPSDTGRNVGYHVGGGSGHPWRAEPRRPDEGTWGWDYQGGFFRRRVILGWWHGQRYQGGTGAYQTDGPKLYQPSKPAD